MRIIARILALLLIPFAGYAQTAAAPAVVDPGWSASCTIPKNGGVCTIKMPARTLQKATTLPVTLSGAKFTMDVQIPPESQFITNPDGTTTITGVTITLTPVAK